MPVSPLPFELIEGLDFDEYFSDRLLVVNTLDFLLRQLPDVSGYCLKFHPVLGGRSWFEPYMPSTMQIPPRIDHERILVDTWNWPVLANHIGTFDQSVYSTPPDALAAANWRGQVRLEANGEFVGYFKLFHCGDSLPPEPTSFLSSFYQAKYFLIDRINARRREKMHELPQFNSFVRETSEVVAMSLAASTSRQAVGHLAVLITSHLTSGLNRFAVFGATGDDCLECIHAHGGSGDDEWSRNVQEPLSRNISSAIQLHGLQPSFFHDPYFLAAVGDTPLRITNLSTSDGMLAHLWRNGGNLDLLPEMSRVNAFEFIEQPSCSRWSRVRSLAAILNQDDPWIQRICVERPDSPIFNSRNGQYFVIPWLNSFGTLLALCITDLGYWGRLDMTRDVPSRLLVATELLRRFSDKFTEPAASCWRS